MRERKGRRNSLRKERKKQYAVMYMYMYTNMNMYMYKLYKDAHKRTCVYVYRHQQAAAMA